MDSMSLHNPIILEMLF
uniref:Uncharacterized protein n=1 Tax=Rhizophora mucronata TaxID=61149 RepID=A0A2P2R4E7_RHIMU